MKVILSYCLLRVTVVYLLNIVVLTYPNLVV